MPEDDAWFQHMLQLINCVRKPKVELNTYVYHIEVNQLGTALRHSLLNHNLQALMTSHLSSIAT